MADGAQYLIREYALPLKPEDYFGVMRSVIAELYESVELKARRAGAAGPAQSRRSPDVHLLKHMERPVQGRAHPAGLDDHFEFYIEAQGPLHKSRPDVFFEALHRLGGTDPVPAPSARIPSTPPAPPTTRASTSSASPTPPAPPMSPPSAKSATSSCRSGGQLKL